MTSINSEPENAKTTPIRPNKEHPTKELQDSSFEGPKTKNEIISPNNNNKAFRITQLPENKNLSVKDLKKVLYGKTKNFEAFEEITKFVEHLQDFADSNLKSCRHNNLNLKVWVTDKVGGVFLSAEMEPVELEGLEDPRKDITKVTKEEDKEKNTSVKYSPTRSRPSSNETTDSGNHSTNVDSVDLLSRTGTIQDQNLKITPIPLLTTKPWQIEILPELRSHLIKKILSSIYPDFSAQHQKEDIGARLVDFSKTIEQRAFEEANGQADYFRRVAEQIHMISKELQQRSETESENENSGNTGHSTSQTIPSQPISPLQLNGQISNSIKLQAPIHLPSIPTVQAPIRFPNNNLLPNVTGQVNLNPSARISANQRILNLQAYRRNLGAAQLTSGVLANGHLKSLSPNHVARNFVNQNSGFRATNGLLHSNFNKNSVAGSFSVGLSSSMPNGKLTVPSKTQSNSNQIKLKMINLSSVTGSESNQNSSNAVKLESSEPAPSGDEKIIKLEDQVEDDLKIIEKSSTSPKPGSLSTTITNRASDSELPESKSDLSSNLSSNNLNSNHSEGKIQLIDGHQRPIVTSSIEKTKPLKSNSNQEDDMMDDIIQRAISQSQINKNTDKILIPEQASSEKEFSSSGSVSNEEVLTDNKPDVEINDQKSNERVQNQDKPIKNDTKNNNSNKKKDPDIFIQSASKINYKKRKLNEG